MNKQSTFFKLLLCFLFVHSIFGQEPNNESPEGKVTPLFESSAILPVRMSYSNKELRRETNDSTYINSTMSFQQDGIWHDLALELRARGKNRLENCYFAPVKISIKKKAAKGTLFEGNKKLKLVLPCLIEKDKNDNVIKEYVAYKLFETISPYHYKTRLVDVLLYEPKGKKIKEHLLRGFLIEDDKTMAKRINAKVYERNVHPMNQDALASVRHAFFQYLIGNTDFSQAYRHNVDLMFINDKMVPIPYDFDMSGLVNCSYAVVSQIGDEQLGISEVTERQYRGFVRKEELLEQVRQEFLSKKEKIFMCLEDCKSIFENEKEYEAASEYISDFFKVMMNRDKFNSEIVDRARTN